MRSRRVAVYANPRKPWFATPLMIGWVACASPDSVHERRSREVCPGSSDAHETLRSMWAALDAEYAVFSERLPQGRDWADIGRSACNTLQTTHRDATLFEASMRMLRTLDDGHVWLEAGDLGLADDAWVSEYPHSEELALVVRNVETSYVGARLRVGAGGAMRWGAIDGVGYLWISRFDELAEPSGGSDEEDRDRRVAAETMGQALAQLSRYPGLVVDLRNHEGGWDSVALEVATWFAGPRAKAWSKQLRAGPEHDDFGPWLDTFVPQGRPDAYRGHTVLLTSGNTFSAGETFVLAMRHRTGVDVVGEQTSGHFSDIWSADLPGGWEIEFSGERYRAADGNVYEGHGVPVDVEVSFEMTARELRRGAIGVEDTMLDRALELAARVRPPASGPTTEPSPAP